jgi:hypothetical protein
MERRALAEETATFGTATECRPSIATTPFLMEALQLARHKPRPLQRSSAQTNELPSWAAPRGEVIALPTGKGSARASAIPRGWEDWQVPPGEKELIAIRDAQEELAVGMACLDERVTYGALVGSVELSEHPVHRWFSYKEAYSPRLPIEVIGRLGTGSSQTVADPCAGVATTALSLQYHPLVNRTVGVEYSPFAHFVGRSKLSWSLLSPKRLERHITRLRDFPIDDDLSAPGLAAFSNDEIFKPRALQALLSAKYSIIEDEHLTAPERDFLLLGLAAIIEDSSRAMKDGRALRILRGRSRRPKALTPSRGALHGNGVRETLTNQWLAMLEDLRVLAPMRAKSRSRRDLHLRGDVRNLRAVNHRGHRQHPLPSSSVGLFVYSPPYLNCIDYTEIYKLELWFLDFVQNETQFRNVRLGTLRSHPSVRFDETSSFEGMNNTTADLIGRMGPFLDERLPRPGLGMMVQNYFEDMYLALVEQHRVLEPGGHTVCVVGNSTFSRRTNEDGKQKEEWRLPVLTDVLIASLAELAGFEGIEIWEARHLRPRNVRAGAARESLVVARKAK